MLISCGSRLESSWILMFNNCRSKFSDYFLRVSLKSVHWSLKYYANRQTKENGFSAVALSPGEAQLVPAGAALVHDFGSVITWQLAESIIAVYHRPLHDLCVSQQEAGFWVTAEAKARLEYKKVNRTTSSHLTCRKAGRKLWKLQWKFKPSGSRRCVFLTLICRGGTRGVAGVDRAKPGTWLAIPGATPKRFFNAAFNKKFFGPGWISKPRQLGKK